MNSLAQLEATVQEKYKKKIKEIVDRLEKQYPVAFEPAIHLTMSAAVDDSWKEGIRDLFGLNWEVDHTSLFLKLNHTSPEIRADAVHSVVDALLKGQVISILLFCFHLL